jgi:bacterioferritin-associated ferredoxin
MIVCHCRSVSDSQVRAAICGADDRPFVFDVEDVTRACGAGGDCGGCHPVIAELLDESRVAVELLSVA